MGKKDGIVEQILKRPPQMKFSDIKTLFLSQGWMMTQESSHVKFRKKGHFMQGLAIREGRYVIKEYIDQIARRLDDKGEVI
jgi:predicted RNA binding protein YcfA (HicA-like mRNA interferase family)